MEKKIALLIIYNHRYDKNIPVLDELFKNKFSYIYHIVPFYDGERENVLPVYESSYYFSGYIAQALNQIKDKSFTHYVFTSDDLMLNPLINESNIHSMIGLDDDDCYLPRFRSLQDPNWPRSLDAMGYLMDVVGAEVKTMLPTKDEACAIFKSHNLAEYAGISSKVARKIVRKQAKIGYNWYMPTRFLFHSLKLLFKRPFSFFEYQYPMIGGYNDFFIIPSSCIDSFSKYCGAFAASKMFVEIAIPTAMVLASKKIKTSFDTKLKCGDLWLEDIRDMEIKYNKNLKSFFDDFPQDLLYRHPVKLSKWK